MASDGLARNLGKQIAGHLRREILVGKLPTDQQLREVELATRFDVSRGPVREALLELTQEGLLVAQPKGGVRVAPPMPDAIQEFVVPIRRTIETYALRLFHKDLKEQDFRSWSELLERMRFACAQQDRGAIAELDLALHRSFLERSGQPDLIAIWSAVAARIDRHFLVSVNCHENLMRIYDDHAALIAAFRDPDVDASASALEIHIG
jgi:DNA-binding GntR family transcriptional regulator